MHCQWIEPIVSTRSRVHCPCLRYTLVTIGERKNAIWKIWRPHIIIWPNKTAFFNATQIIWFSIQHSFIHSSQFFVDGIKILTVAFPSSKPLPLHSASEEKATQNTHESYETFHMVFYFILIGLWCMYIVNGNTFQWKFPSDWPKERKNAET